MTLLSLRDPPPFITGEEPGWECHPFDGVYRHDALSGLFCRAFGLCFNYEMFEDSDECVADWGPISPDRPCPTSDIRDIYGSLLDHMGRSWGRLPHLRLCPPHDFRTGGVHLVVYGIAMVDHGAEAGEGKAWDWQTPGGCKIDRRPFVRVPRSKAI